MSCLLGLTLCALPALAQVAFGVPSTSSSSTSSTAATVVSRTLRGHVVNSVTGAAIPRVLVQVGARTVLTDSQGRFELPQFTDAQAYVVLTNPQFSQTNDLFQSQGRQRLSDLDAVAELKMYPDATVVGTVTGGDGLPLSGLNVQLLRQFFNPAAGLMMQPTKFGVTNSRGEFRFRVPAGRFELTIFYNSRTRETGEAVLPLTYPDNTGSYRSAYFEAAPGEEKHVDLRPKTGPLFPFSVRVEGGDGERGAQFSAVTSNNEILQVNGGAPGEGGPDGVVQLSLPKGTYTLQARVQTRDTETSGSTRITVTGNQTEPAVIHLLPAISLPVEVSIDPASTTAAQTNNTNTAGIATTSVQTIPSPGQFNLSLQNDPPVLNQQGNNQLRAKPDKTFEFRMAPGRYRLTGNGGGAWHVESATYGVTDALTSDIVISSGGGGAPIRLVVSNVYGSVTGTVQFANATDPAWVYLIPTTPTLAPVNPISINNNGNGTANFTSRVPAGSYLAIELDHRIADDLRNPDVIARLSGNAKPLTISSSAAATVNLVLSTEKEPGP